jgi:hypothetical protein
MFMFMGKLQRRESNRSLAYVFGKSGLISLITLLKITVKPPFERTFLLHVTINNRMNNILDNTGELRIAE